ncbi:MAG TPA: methyltransferase domain-containing protein [Bryobacteraceae bacterium]|nr:methyltransferase domain-containing protein [Bryobacteraceae bacterium]
MTFRLTRRRLLVLASILAVAALGAADRIVSRCQSSLASMDEAERLVQLAGVGPGMHVAEIGAGDGRMALMVARLLAPAGRIYATEMEDGQLTAIREAAAAAGVGNVVVVQAAEASAGLPEGCCDVIYMRRVHHHMSDPVAVHKTLHAALRPGGRLVVIDFMSPGWRFYRKHGMAHETVVEHLAQAGFTLDREVARWSLLDYCLVFRKTGEGASS